MLKLLPVVLLAPFLLVALVLVAPFATLYFCFDRLCDCIEDFKPARRRKPKKRGAGVGQLARLLNRIPTSA